MGNNSVSRSICGLPQIRKWMQVADEAKCWNVKAILGVITEGITNKKMRGNHFGLFCCDKWNLKLFTRLYTWYFKKLRTTETNWRKTNGNCIREMWHRLQELSVFYCKSGFPVCPVQASYELIFCPPALAQRSKEDLSFSYCPLLHLWEQKVNTSSLQQLPPNLATHWFSYQSVVCMRSAWWIAV